MNCISATGRMPIIAAPTAAPTIAVSEIGVSMTRSSPNSRDEAVGDLEGAAVDADVFAEQEDALVPLHLLAQALADRVDVGGLALGGRRSRRPCASEVRARRSSRPPEDRGLRSPGGRVDALERDSGCGQRALLGELDLAVDLLGDRPGRSRRARSAVAAAGLDERARVSLDRVLRAPLLELLLRHVAWPSCSACPFIRYVMASRSVGPPPARARSTARRAAS